MVDPIEAVVDSELLVQQLPDLFAPDPAAAACIVGLCLGAFVLAEAGLLGGKTATTHCYRAQMLAERYPAVHVDRDVLLSMRGMS